MLSGVTLSLTAEPRRLVNLAFPTPRSALFACTGPGYNGLRQSGATQTRDPLHEGWVRTRAVCVVLTRSDAGNSSIYTCVLSGQMKSQW